MRSRLACVAIALLFMAPALRAQERLRPREPRDWKTLETEHFHVHYSDDDILEPVREVAQWAEDALAKIGPRLGAGLRRPAHIFVYRSQNDFQRTTLFPGGMPDGVAGVTELYQDRIALPLFGSAKFMQRLVEHEFTHQLMMNQYYDWKIPSYLFLKDPFIPEWYVEGLAEWGAGAEDTWERMLMRDAVLEGRLRHLYELHGFGHLNPHEVREAYTTGYFALKYLESAHGEGSVRKLFEAWDGFPWPASTRLGPITKKSYEAFDTDFRKAMQEEFLKEAAGKSEPDGWATPLTRNDSYYRRHRISPRYSPDGTRVAYLSDRSKAWSVHVVDAEGGGGRSPLAFRVNNTIEEADDSLSGLSWSPDGTRIAFVAERGGRKDVFTCGPDLLDGVRRLGFGFDELSSPAWSPDGQWIAFSGLDRGRTDLWLGNVETGELRRLTEDREHDDFPCWSPDGTSIVYARESEGQTDLVVLDVATRGTEILARTHANEITPQFSPDGKYLAYASDEGGIWNLWLMELEGGRARRLTDVPTGAVSPSWGPGGKLAFAYYRRGEWHLWTLTLDLSTGEWAPVPVSAPRDWYRDLQIRPVEAYEVHPLSNRWHLDLLLPFGVANVASASTLTGDHVVAAAASITGTVDGVRMNADLAYWNRMLPVPLFVDIFDRYETFEERDIERTEHKIGFIAGAGVGLDEYRSILLGYTLFENRIKFDDDDLNNTDPRNGAIVFAATHDNVIGRGINPSGGFLAQVGAEFYHRDLGSQERRTTWFWNWRQYVEIWEDVVVALGSTGRLSHGPDPDVFDIADVVRGYGGGRVEGRNAAGATVELRFPIFRDINWTFPGQLFLVKDVRAYVFGDMGFSSDDHAHEVLRTTGHPDWRHSLGAGIWTDLWLLEQLPVPLGLEFSQPTDSHQSFRVRLTLGVSF